VSDIARIGLDDGAWLWVETTDSVIDGPVKAGRVADAVQELPGTLRSALSPVARASLEILSELRSAGPGEVKVEFGVTLTVGAGAILAKGETGCHLKVTLGWSSCGAGDNKDSEVQS
jgi:hypothetical protein